MITAVVVEGRTQGELLRELTIDPTRDYQPQRPANTTKPPNP
ncbi:hypothetical protein [Streptomyces ureilyticus]|nr:hypothetical protein [Streptomyces ureilyticus]